jgi:predicted glycogen debranching enzyme
MSEAAMMQSRAADSGLTTPALPTLSLGRDVFDDLEAVSRREWIVTNGIGGYAAGTVGGVNTRRYHGLLVAALAPPVERTAMVAKLDATVRYHDMIVPLASNEFADGTVAPHGYRQLAAFRLDGLLPVWTWLVGDALIEQCVWMTHGRNTTYVTYRLVRASGPVELELTPLCTYRDYHWQHRGRRDADIRALDNGFEVVAYRGARPYRVLLEQGQFELTPDWYWNFKHREEGARGLDDVEDLLRPAVIRVPLEAGATAAVVLTAETEPVVAADASLAAERARQQELLAQARLPRRAPAWIDRLTLAADQFIVERRDRSGATLGKTVIAGYPWFSDWGRDTMIALPGLTLATGRVDDAASILRTFARFVDAGMLPNRFPDGGETPEYNTVDATLWYFVAVHAYLAATNDGALRRELYPALADIVAWHRHGTRYGIHVDPNDGLLYAGEAGVQLTWMDAKVGDWVVTPRVGKCVEINALWFNALEILASIAAAEDDAAAATDYRAQAARVADSFGKRFWYAGGYLYDVVDGPDGDDASLRPNQLLAISLPHALLDGERARAVVDTCARELWTPVGLRSLSPSDPRYVAEYHGGPRERDGAYHQGTVWSWLLGAFVDAYRRVHGDAATARCFLDGMAAHLREACVGQISEIFDGDAPFTPRGCFAQAWGVAEILRSWRALDER